MILLSYVVLIVLSSVCISNADYAATPSGENEQSDVQAPAYVPSYMKNAHYGTKTGYAGTKTGYAGTKTGYAGTKTGYAGTKTGYYGTKTGYTGTKTWNSESGAQPNFESFKDSANRPYDPICEPDCKNNGICVDTGVCHCPQNFYGNRCEYQAKPCLTYPPLSMNSKRKCSSELCTVVCAEGHQFPDGTTAANLVCAEGVWRPARADLASIPDCVPTCSPPCLNGGACLARDTCQCPQDYRGPQCQYAATACDVRKLGFNGGYNCFGDGERFSCRLSCPAGATYSVPPAPLYTCLYSDGVYRPQPIPLCQFDTEMVIITPSSHHDYNMSRSYYETHYESKHGGSRSQNNYGRRGQASSHSSSHGGSSNTSFGHHSFNSFGLSSGAQHIVIQDLVPKGGTCFTWSGTHYKTFDGKIYSFQSPCQHVLLRDVKDHKFTIAVRQGDCKRQFYCPSEITIFLEDKQYILSVGEEGGVVFRSTKRLLPVPASLPGLRVRMARDAVLVTLDGLGLDLKWDANNQVIVEASVVLWNNTEGLCGRLDGSAETDLVTKEGKRASTRTALASSWQLNKIGDICDGGPTETSACKKQPDDVVKKGRDFCVKLFSKEKFRKCSTVMDVSLLLEACQWDYCACNSNLSPEECACNTVAVYAQECLRHGLEGVRMWRDPDTCPMKCPEGKLYNPCGPDSQPSCASPLVSAGLDNATCVEGCYCPDGLLLEGGRCVPKEQCPCRLRAKAFPPGSVVTKDCNTCACEAGQWRCTQVPCGARCGAVGDPHYVTFDGLRYDFMGHCTYTLLQAENVTIDVENVACSGAISEAMNLSPSSGSGKPSCTKAVTLKYGDVVVNMKQGGFITANDKAVSRLPVQVGNVIIRVASSLFIIVQLPNGVDLWWDGNTRVFVDVPPSFHDKTKGLCGTFNLNQKDDYLTPEGDVEQSPRAFANKWRTRELCADVQAAEPPHPCTTNVENKEVAQNYCAKLKSKLFESCHWFVDVEPYYEACVYDMCACEDDVTRCLCPILGDYAMACAKSGVHIQWRYNVKECELSCTGGQEYTVCADSCLRSCSDVALLAAGRCKPSCAEGCACAAGSVLDAAGACVPVAKCPCYHLGIQFQTGYKMVRPGRREQELCTCVGATWDCRPATAAEIVRYPPAEDMRTNCSAALNQEFTTCEIAEPLTCKNMHLPPPSTSAECRPGCQCKKGYVLDAGAKRCVLPAQCPCHHGGRSYVDGHVMQEECNTCECKSGNWTCSQRRCSGVCSTWGDSHFTTFDGKEYDFEGVCTYLMAKGVLEIGKDGFVVEIQNVPCGTTGATCSKSITLKIGNGDNEEVVSLTKDAPLPEVTELKRIKLRLAGAFVFLDVPSLGVGVQWDRGTRVYVKVDPMWSSRVKGLCGNYNLDVRDDFQTPSGGGMAEASALLFADSWKLKQTCPKTVAVRDHCEQRPERQGWARSVCGALKQPPFSLCHGEVGASEHVARCERDACACDTGEDCACACAALAAYAYTCAQRGVVFPWRTQQLCPMQCDEQCSNYDACVSPCEPETCDNTLHYEEIKSSCEKDTCVEGCKPKLTCPDGSLYTNSSHLECIPRAKCRPPCMTLEDGTVILEGEVIEEDACHTCRCSKKERVCTGVPCSTQKPIMSTVAPTVQVPANEPLKCMTGWTSWVNTHAPETSSAGVSTDVEPLPSLKDLQIGSPMCKKEMVTKVECRTVAGHTPAKETGLDAECSLEKGLICKESAGKTCPDFEIRVYCQCEAKPFQCLDSAHPSHPHPTDCSKFYECTPDPASPEKPHAVLKDCAAGLFYNPVTMVCDWPASVELVRPECGKESRVTLTTVSTSSTTSATVTLPASTTRACPPGYIYSECAYPCNKLCDYFKKTLKDQGKCSHEEECVYGCVEESVAKIKCDFGALWRDENTCVPVRDCTCYGHDGAIIRPHGVDIEGCLKCQCLDNKFHCDNSKCVSIVSPVDTATVRESLVSPPPTPSTTILIVKTTVSPPPECREDRYKNLVWGSPSTDIKLTASSSANKLYEPQNSKLNGEPTKNTSGGWKPKVMDDQQYIQVELPRREPVYGVKMQGSPRHDEFVTSYELMYGDDGNAFDTVDGPDGKPKVFRGPVDHTTVSKQMLEPPIEAKFVRIRPLTWHGDIAVRLELIGCDESLSTTALPNPTTTELPQCSDSTQSLQGGLPVSNIEVSSQAEDRKYMSLNSDRGWKPLYSTPGEWIMWDLNSEGIITGIKTKGGPTGWVTGYHVMYSSDLKTFHTVSEADGSSSLFPGNFDATSVVSHPLKPPLRARYFKLIPVTWHNNIEIRAEPDGCYEPYICMEPLGLQGGLPEDQLEVSSNSDQRRYLSLDADRGWRAQYNAPGEWIMWDLTGERNITSLRTMGGPSGWVTGYHVMYSSDLNTFHAVTKADGSRSLFPGNVDATSVVSHALKPPLRARYFKLLPVTWHNNIEIRAEPIGCYEPYICVEPLGLQGGLAENQLEVSSNSEQRRYLSLDEDRGWRAQYNAPGEWIMWDLTGERNITSVKTMGGPSGWVTGYHVMYSSDLNTFHSVSGADGSRSLFPGNVDATSVVSHALKPPLRARYFKLLPVTWHNNIELRAEPFGCFEYSSSSTVVESTSQHYTSSVNTTATCQLCPHVLAPSDGTCTCAGDAYYDGEGCTERAQCPCIVGYMSYAVGSTFRGSQCDECVCKLGGITQCKPVKECKCSPELVPKLSATCECECSPCPAGTRVCPTSHTCLLLEKWCDGVQDCPDDERDCTTEAPHLTTVVRTVAAVVNTTPLPKTECPKVECPPGYKIHYTTGSGPGRRTLGAGELPPPRPRLSYQRYYKGGSTKTGFTKTGYTKTYSSKGSFPSPAASQSFNLAKPSSPTASAPPPSPCAQFRCVAALPPLRPGVTRAPIECSTPKCPPDYRLRLDSSVAMDSPCPQYSCAPPPDRPVFCNVTGRTINTFDGTEYKYDICFHILARDNRFDAWTILVRKKCRVDSCVNELMVRQDDEMILVKPNLMIEYDNYEYTYEQTSMICFQKNSFDISKLGNGLAISSRRYNFTVFYHTNGDVKIGVLKNLMGTVDGLCGAFDGEPSNDRRLPDGRHAVSIDEFGRAWAKPGLSPTACQTRTIPPEKQKRVWELCNVITKEPLSLCEKVLNLDKWRSICLEKICECSELVLNGTRRTEEQCRCELLQQFVAECMAADKDVDLSVWRIDVNCPGECPPPLVHHDCYRKRCEPSCPALGVVRPCPAAEGRCEPGCYCAEGKLRQGDSCVAPTDCRDCVCNGAGSPATYVTFERDTLPFSGTCTYLVARDTSATAKHAFQVYATNGPCKDQKDVVCTKAIHLMYEKNILHIQKDSKTKKLVTTINGEQVFKYPLKNEWATVTLLAGQDVHILVPDVHLELSVLEAKMEFYVRVPSHVYADRTEGLCGVCAGYREHLVLSNGSDTDDVQLYGKSWLAPPEMLSQLDVPQQDECGEKQVKCVIPPPDQDLCYNVFNKDQFGACHALVEPQAYAETCRQELCAEAGVDVCVVLERYAAQCSRLGVCVPWRDSRCPFTCPTPLIYRPCVDCQLTCDNYEELSKDPSKCNKPQVAGCYCPEGKVRLNNTCIEPTKCFPCDAEKQHYAGDDWQEDACTMCRCSKMAGERGAQVSCTTQGCTTPVCDEDHDLVKQPGKPGACCSQYVCVPKPQDNPVCEEPKKITCGFGQVLKQKTTSNGCKEFACECKPTSECDPLPNPNDVSVLEPGMEREIDESGCCPVARLVCRPETCPEPDTCPPHHTRTETVLLGTCCKQYHCELPKDKCYVTLEWEAAPKGGEKPRSEPKTMLKNMDEVWLDGPCRRCRCESVGGSGGAGGGEARAEARCSVAECAAITSTADHMLEPRAEPFSCCPRAVAVACRDGDAIYKVGEKWTSPTDACVRYECVEVDEGKLEKITTVNACDNTCQPGWKYERTRAQNVECCGACVPVACVVAGLQRPIGDSWSSPDNCTHYTCVNLNGTLQVQSYNESCPKVEEAMKKQFVMKEKKVSGQCCSTYEAVACRAHNHTYPEGASWQSDEPCKNVTCARDAAGALSHVESVESCRSDCERGWRYVAPDVGRCCGRCEPHGCLVEGEIKMPGESWSSEDNCTSYSCLSGDGSALVTSSSATCPDLARCPPHLRYTDGCCQRCKEEPLAQSTCSPESLSDSSSTGVLRVTLGHHGECVNTHPLPEFKECRGSCASGTLYNNQTGSHDSRCTCCQAVQYEPLVAELRCADGSLQKHRVASVARCACLRCGDLSPDTTTIKQESEEYPDIDKRIGKNRKL